MRLPGVSPAGIAVHTSYAPAVSGSHAWGAPLYALVMRSSAAPTSGVELTAHGASLEDVFLELTADPVEVTEP